VLSQEKDLTVRYCRGGGGIGRPVCHRLGVLTREKRLFGGRDMPGGPRRARQIGYIYKEEEDEVK
jgi:hypothetical protein